MRVFSESARVCDLGFAALSVVIVLATLGEYLFGKVAHIGLLFLLAASVVRIAGEKDRPFERIVPFGGGSVDCQNWNNLGALARRSANGPRGRSAMMDGRPTRSSDTLDRTQLAHEDKA